MKKLQADLIAPCGFNCALCAANQKKEGEKGYCSGCYVADGKEKAHCSKCAFNRCPVLKDNGYRFCYECDKFPCRKLELHDEKYIKCANASVIENLKYIKQHGVDAFFEVETIRWKCRKCGELICMPKNRCLHCNRLVPKKKENYE